jgi:hypothetical protein
VARGAGGECCHAAPGRTRPRPAAAAAHLHLRLGIAAVHQEALAKRGIAAAGLCGARSTRGLRRRARSGARRHRLVGARRSCRWSQRAGAACGLGRAAGCPGPDDQGVPRAKIHSGPTPGRGTLSAYAWIRDHLLMAALPSSVSAERARGCSPSDAHSIAHYLTCLSFQWSEIGSIMPIASGGGVAKRDPRV